MITATARVANQEAVMLEVAVTMSVPEWDQALTSIAYAIGTERDGSSSLARLAAVHPRLEVGMNRR